MLKIQATDQTDLFSKLDVEYTDSPQDSLAIQQTLQNLLLQLQTQSYLAASIDSIHYDGKAVTAYLRLGQPYEWLTLQNGNIPNEVLQAIGAKKQFFKKEKFAYSELIELQDAIVGQAENSGYPFAEVRLDSVQINGRFIEGRLYWNRNQLITIEGIKIIGDAKISSAFLANFLDLKQGTIYNKAKILTINNRLQNLPYLQTTQNPKITFKNNEATVNLFLKNKTASRFDLLVGLQPDERQLLPNRSFVVTGNGLIDLVNAFGKGERLFLEFQQVRPQTQELTAQISYPYILNIPFGGSFDFDLYKNDTTFLNLNYTLGIEYFINGNQSIKAFFKNQVSQLLSVDESQIIQSRILPSNLDFRQSLFGVSYKADQLDYRFNPRKGWAWELSAAAGEKRIERNADIGNLVDPNDMDFEFASLYERVDAPIFQYQLEAAVAYFLPIGKRSTCKIGVQNGSIFTNNIIVENELYRIGGNQLMRGFDEQAILASQYTIGTLEYRWLLGQNSNLYFFTDVGYVEKKGMLKTSYQQPLGLGLGINFDTKVGVFGISGAVGKDLRNQDDFFDLRNP